jgi:hypothetical protein
MYTPYLTITARRLNLEVGIHVHRLSHDIKRGLNPGYDPVVHAARQILVIGSQ